MQKRIKQSSASVDRSFLEREFFKSVHDLFENDTHRTFFKNHPAKEKLLDKLSEQILGARLAGYLIDDYATKKIIYDLTRAWCRIMVNDHEKAERMTATKWETKNDI